MYLAGHSHVLLTLAIAGNGGWQAGTGQKAG